MLSRSGSVLREQSPCLSPGSPDQRAFPQYPSDRQVPEKLPDPVRTMSARLPSLPDRERHPLDGSSTRRRPSDLRIPGRLGGTPHTELARRNRRLAILAALARLLRERATALGSPTPRQSARPSSNRERASSTSPGRGHGPPRRSEKQRRPACHPAGARSPDSPGPVHPPRHNLAARRQARPRRKRARSRFWWQRRARQFQQFAQPVPAFRRILACSQKRNRAAPRRIPHSVSPVSVSHSSAARKLSCSRVQRSSHSVPSALCSEASSSASTRQ